MLTLTMTHRLVAARRQALKAYDAAQRADREFCWYIADADLLYGYQVLHCDAHHHKAASAWHGEFHVSSYYDQFPDPPDIAEQQHDFA